VGERNATLRAKNRKNEKKNSWTIYQSAAQALKTTGKI
jgi:hypothetical protein